MPIQPKLTAFDLYQRLIYPSPTLEIKPAFDHKEVVSSTVERFYFVDGSIIEAISTAEGLNVHFLNEIHHRVDEHGYSTAVIPPIDPRYKPLEASEPPETTDSPTQPTNPPTSPGQPPIVQPGTVAPNQQVTDILRRVSERIGSTLPPLLK